VILCHHPVNQERVNAGLKPANCLWLWGQSKPVELPTLKERWPIQGAVVSQSGPYLGVAMASGLQAVKVEARGEENEPDRLRRMATMASKILEKQDLACLHIPFSVLALHQGQSTPGSLFVEYLEQIDEHLIGPLQQSCVGIGESRLFVIATPCANKLEEDAPLPARYVLYDGQDTDGEPSTLAFHDQEVSAHPLQNAATFFERFFGKK
jgi:2,3-bisphosphoglycerate-independent phosphoglycerate mutase